MALCYFFNGNVDGQYIEYGIQCLEKIDKAILKEKNRFKYNVLKIVNFDTIDYDHINHVNDLIHVYYFNENKIGINFFNIKDDENKKRVKITYLNNYDSIEDLDGFDEDLKDTILYNYDIWKKMCVKLIKSKIKVTEIRRSNALKPLDDQKELIVIYLLSKKLQKKYNYKIQRGNDDRYLLINSSI